MEILHINKSATLLSLARFDEALDSVNKALRLVSNNMDSLNLKGTIYIFLHCDIFKHVYIFQKNFLNCKIGKILISLKMFNETLLQFDKSIELNPFNDKSIALKGK